MNRPLSLVCAALVVGCVANLEYPFLRVEGDADLPVEDTGNDQDSGVPEDTGEPTGDTGITPPMDTGTVPRDTGTVPRDTGTVPRDTGTVPRDTGTAPTDTGTVPTDTGVIPSTCAPVPTFADGFRAVRERYVAPTGRNSNDGSAGAPWGSIGYAMQNASPGDRITVRAGRYTTCGEYVSRDYTAANPIWVRGEDGVVLNCGGAGGSGLRFFNAHYIVVENVEVTGAGDHGVHIDGGSQYILLRGLRVHHVENALVKASQSDHIYIERNDYHHAGPNAWSSQGIDFVGVSDSHILYNAVHDIPDNVAIQAKGGSTNVLMANNALWSVGEAFNLGGATGPEYFSPAGAQYEGRNVVARNNLVGAIHRAFTAQGCWDCQIISNTIWGGGDNQGLRAVNGNTGTGGVSRTRNLLVANNIVAWPSGTTMVPCLMDDGRDGLRVLNNLWWSATRTIGDSYNISVCAGAGTLMDQNPRLAAPDADPADFRPRTDSPAVGRASTTVGVARDDFTGACRSGAPDLGAFQH